MSPLVVVTHLLAFLLGMGTVAFGITLAERLDESRLRKAYPEEMARLDAIRDGTLQLQKDHDVPDTPAISSEDEEPGYGHGV